MKVRILIISFVLFVAAGNVAAVSESASNTTGQDDNTYYNNRKFIGLDCDQEVGKLFYYRKNRYDVYPYTFRACQRKEDGKDVYYYKVRNPNDEPVRIFFNPTGNIDCIIEFRGGTYHEQIFRKYDPNVQHGYEKDIPVEFDMKAQEEFTMRIEIHNKGVYYAPARGTYYWTKPLLTRKPKEKEKNKECALVDPTDGYWGFCNLLEGSSSVKFCYDAKFQKSGWGAYFRRWYDPDAGGVYNDDFQGFRWEQKENELHCWNKKDKSDLWILIVTDSCLKDKKNSSIIFKHSNKPRTGYGLRKPLRYFLEDAL